MRTCKSQYFSGKRHSAGNETYLGLKRRRLWDREPWRRSPGGEAARGCSGPGCGRLRCGSQGRMCYPGPASAAPSHPVVEGPRVASGSPVLQISAVAETSVLFITRRCTPCVFWVYCWQIILTTVRSRISLCPSVRCNCCCLSSITGLMLWTRRHELWLW